MRSRLLLLIILASFKIIVFANNFPIESSTFANNESSGIDSYQFDSRFRCSEWGWWCDIKFGLANAESNGTNGLLLSGYTYHFPLHNPMEPADGHNELALGAGYTRSFYNPDYNSEYSLYVLGFKDTYSQPQIQAGYFYQNYLNMNTSGSMKFGFGYSAFLWVKPAFSGELPIPYPGLSWMISLKYKNVGLLLTGIDVPLLAAKIDF